MQTALASLLAALTLLGWGASQAPAGYRDTSGKNYLSLPAKIAPGAHPIAFTDNAVDNAVIEEAELPGADDITGAWRLATQVESSDVARYNGLLLGYEIHLEQDGDRVTGNGWKIIENGSGIDSRGQTPIAVSGVVDGDRITLRFIEGGARRTTQGTFILMRDADGMLHGRFTSDAARSTGSVEARRVR